MKFPVIPGCKPAKVYLALAVIAFVYCVVKGHMGSTMLLYKAVFIVAWTAFLVFVCKSRLPQGARPLTWVLVFLPFAYMWYTTGGMMEGMESKSCAKCKATHKSCNAACLKAGGDTDKCNKKCKDGYLKCYGSSCSN